MGANTSTLKYHCNDVLYHYSDDRYDSCAYHMYESYTQILSFQARALGLYHVTCCRFFNGLKTNLNEEIQ